MIGAIIGDIAGAPYESDKLGQDKRDYRPFFLNGLAKFTDDTNLTIAVADAILNDVPYHVKYLEWYKKNPDLGYGSSFKEWADKGGNFQNDSRGNGAVMRISPIALFAMGMSTIDNQGDVVLFSIEDQLQWAYEQVAESTKMTHNTPEARNGGLAAVTAMIMAGRKFDKEDIRQVVSDLSKYDLTVSLETVRNDWSKRDIRCDITVPQALIAFLESHDFESAVRNAVYSKGDTDTIAAIAGAIAEYYYGVETINPGILAETKLRLQPEMIDIVNQCYANQLKW